METRTIGGIHLHYFVLCKRKLWLYEHGITMEQEDDRVLEGKVLHQRAYPQIKKREILIDNAFKVDMIDGGYIREVKISSKMPEVDKMQMLFYLYQLEQRGIKKKGLISYTTERKTVGIELNKENRKLIKNAITRTKEIIEQDQPPILKKYPYCKSCAYFSFCYSMEDDDEC
ncbi:CRISPR-associated protein Cas4 [Scopulibacillus cellulosilyticus]|uniref:CRISPR-associated exonuclease Cas4 n=1 Tax=Scopulibacillus cellulosilyticus TaxID=2665665 RepID=A0ABW2Q1V1_9BACL